MVLLVLPPAAPAQTVPLLQLHHSIQQPQTPSQMLLLQHFLQISPSFIRTVLTLRSKPVSHSFTGPCSAEAQTVALVSVALSSSLHDIDFSLKDYICSAARDAAADHANITHLRKRQVPVQVLAHPCCRHSANWTHTKA